nr:uncharacterized protein LOC109181148 [Ipomoea trifida]GLL49912.1 uncharacterized protein LOC109181148 [Ipomoea trifida]
MASEAIAEIEELIKVEEVGEGDLQALGGHQNAHKMERAMEKKNERRGGFMGYGFLHPRFLCSPLAGFPPLPGGGGHWSPYAHLFPPQVVNGHSLLAQVSPPPAMIFPGGGNAFPGGANNSPVMAEDGGLDLTLRL